MFCRTRALESLYWGVSIAALIVMGAGCSREHYKADADEEVYEIIKSKWRGDFGQRRNYRISDAASPNDIQLEKGQPASGIISLAEAVAIATAHNRGYQTRKEELYLSALSLTLERYYYTRQWFGTIDGGYASEEGDSDVSAASSGGFEHTQLLANGILFSTSLAIDWARFLTGDSRTTLGSVLSAGLEVPLLGYGAGKIEREELTQKERNVLYQIRSFNRFRKEFVVSIITSYYGVISQRDEVTNAENNYKRVGETRDRLEAEAAAGRKPPFEVDQAEQNLLRARDGVVRARQRYEKQLDEFKLRLSLPTDAQIELNQNELEALAAIGISEPNYTVAEAIETALVRRLDLANSADFVDDSARKMMLAADGLWSQINLVAGLNVASKEETDFTGLQFHEGLYNLGLEADLPLDRKLERNAYRTAMITLSRQQRQYEEDMDEVKLDVRNAFRKLAEAAELYRIGKSSLELGQKRVESTSLLLDAGRATTRDWLESQDALLEAQNDLTSALVGHTVAKLNFFRDVGILQVMPDGMWEY